MAEKLLEDLGKYGKILTQREKTEGPFIITHVAVDCGRVISPEEFDKMQSMVERVARESKNVLPGYTEDHLAGPEWGARYRNGGTDEIVFLPRGIQFHIITKGYRPTLSM